MHHSIINALDNDTCLITANNRLALELITDYARQKKDSVLVKPACLPYRLFLQQLFKSLCNENPGMHPPVLLNDAQTRYLWIRILTASLDNPPNQGLIDAVIESYHRARLWQLSLDSPDFDQNSQTALFKDWVTAFEAALLAENALTDYHLADWIMETGKAPFLKKCIWYCFDDYTPEQRALQTFLENCGTKQIHADLPSENLVAYQLIAADERDEWAQLFEWIQVQLKNNVSKIGVVVPNLQNQAAALQRLFNRHLPKESFSISLGKKFSDYPLVSHALAWLRLDKIKLSHLELKLLLHSPFFKDSRTDFQARAQCLQHSALLEKEQVSYAKFKVEAEKYAPGLANILEALVDYPDEASPHDWAFFFAKRLQSAGFPGEYRLDSGCWQCYQRFLLVFDELKQLGYLADRWSAAEALAAFEDLLSNLIFQPKTQPTPIHVLGLLEASGCQFESLWVCGLTDQCLPQQVKLNPFIPFGMQKEKFMPHANAEKEWMLAEKQILRLRLCSKTTVFSYPAYTKDTPNLPSPLLASLEKCDPVAIDSSQDLTALENFEESWAVRVNKENLSASSTLLANQAKCPFKAFAAHRLKASVEPCLSIGIGDRRRGEMIHKIMELLMGQLKTQLALTSLSEDMLDKLVYQAVMETLKGFETEHALEQELEVKRLKRLAHLALDWEKRRGPFTVEAVEKAMKFYLEGIEFNLRVDRIDKIPSGEKWIIDYKSSLPAMLPWNESRPREPQLLLYAFMDKTIDTLIFSVLKNGQHRLAGLSANPDKMEGISQLKPPQTWENHRQQWQENLRQLAIEYREGHCLPKPLNATVCHQCDFSSLCRIGTL